MRWVAPGLIVAAAIAANCLHVLAPFGGDDGYVLPNLMASDPGRFLFAFHFDAPSPVYAPWWTGLVYQRRFLRFLPCLLLAGEARVFGRWAPGYHAVTLILVIAALLVVYQLLVDWLGDRVAVCAALLPIACHPALGEIVFNLNCQPLAAAGLFAALAAQQWIRWRRTGARGAFVASLVLAFAAMTGYEAAVVVPVLLVLGDVWFVRDGRWRPRVAVLALLVAYLPLAMAVRAGVVHPETQPLRSLGEVWETTRIDGGNYLLKTFGVFDPERPIVYPVYNALGELAALAIALALVTITAVAARRQRWAWLGAAAFAALLAPPLLTRAAVSRINIPVLRQLYLPVVLALPVVTAAIAITPSYRRVRVAVLAAVAVVLGVQSVRGGFVPGRAARERISRQVRALLADRDPAQPVVLVGRTDCMWPASGDTPAPLIPLFPAMLTGRPPAVKVLDDHTLEAHAAEGFDVPLAEPMTAMLALDRARYSGGGFRMQRLSPFDHDGTVHVPGAVIHIVDTDGHHPTTLRATLDTPLSQSTVLVLDGCRNAKRMETLQ